MHLRRTVVAATSALVAACSALVVLGAAAAHADVPEPVALPAGPVDQRVQEVAASGADVYAVWSGGGHPTALYRTPADGTGTWTAVLDPATGSAVDHAYGVRDGVVLTSCVHRPAGLDCDAWGVIAGGTEWDTAGLPDYTSTIRIGAGGQLVEVERWVASEQRMHYDVYDAVAGPAGGPLFTTTHPIAITGRWVWTVGDHGVLTGHEVSGTLADRVVEAGDDCSSATFLDVSVSPDDGAAWALLQCAEGADHPVVVDLSGTSGPLLTTLPFTTTDQLGDGFSYAIGPGELLHVADFGSPGSSQDYGPFGGGSLWGDQRSGAMSAGDDDGVPFVAYQTPLGAGVDVASLPWLTAAPTRATDTSRPAVTGVEHPARILRAGPDDDTDLTYSWSGSDDDTAPLRYTAQAIDTGLDDPRWTTIPGAGRTFGTTATARAGDTGTVWCFRVRAIDRAGNTSPWSDSPCTHIDGDRPLMTDSHHDTAALPAMAHGIGKVAATYRFHGVDDVRIVSYDVQRRVARRGAKSLGPWRSPARLQGLTVRRVPTTLRSGEEQCFRARAHDEVGHVGAWGDRWCVAAAYDDRTFAVHGGTRRRVASFLGGTGTELVRQSDSVTRPHVAGRELWIRARTASGSCPLVWWGGKEVMGQTCTIDGPWFHVRLPHLRTGTVRIQPGIQNVSALIDAVAVVR